MKDIRKCRYKWVSAHTNIIDADLNIYVLDRTYDYQLWETDLSHDISSDSYLGNGTIKRPVGLIITVSKNS